MVEPEISDIDEEVCLLPPSSADQSPLRSWRPRRSLSQGEQLPTYTSPDEIESPVRSTKHKARHINYVSLGFIAYFAVAAGPFGIEDAVQAAGGLPVLIAVTLLPFTWGLPQALMTAELSTMMDENGGYILWVRRGMGEFAGWINAFNSVACNICDLPTYPVLFASYVQAYLSSQGFETSSLQLFLLKLVALAFVFVSNVFGMRVVALSSIAMSLFVLAPFLLEPIDAKDLCVEAWTQIAPTINWSVFLSTVVWNYQGWDSLGCIAGEVHDGSRAYPLAILIALVLITINYAVPVAVGLAVIPDISMWGEGTLETVAAKISNLFGIWVGLAAVIATLGEFNVVMSCSSRALWATARYRMLPRVLSLEWGRYHTPVAAIAFQSITTGYLMMYDFKDLVILDTFFNNVSLLLEFIAYLRLKYIEPDTPRGFVVPGGILGAWIITVPKVVVISCVLVAQGESAWIYGGIFNLSITILYLIWAKFHKHSQYSPNIPPNIHS